MPFGLSIDLNKVRVFATVAERGSFTAAAKALDVPVSSVSRAVSSLEEALGVQLLRRSTRGTGLTPAGARYHEQVRGALQLIERADGHVVDETAEMSGRIRITAPSVTVAGMLSPLITRFRRRHPAVTFDILSSSGTLDLVTHDIDIALRMGRVTDAALVARKVGETVPRLYASPNYLEARGTPLRAQELSLHDGVLFKAHHPNGTLELVDAGGRTRAVTLRPAFFTDDYMVIRHAVLDGCGIGLIPTFFAEADLAAGALVRVLPELSVPSSAVWMVSAVPTKLQPERVRLFKEHLVETLTSGRGSGQ